ncbi:hypothetical protein [Clostridium sporogenes]|nr:hypothetical protein [Clostridium sporogenes]
MERFMLDCCKINKGRKKSALILSASISLYIYPMKDFKIYYRILSVVNE